MVGKYKKKYNKDKNKVGLLFRELIYEWEMNVTKFKVWR